MNILLIAQFISSLICVTTTIALAMSSSKPSCPEKCGNFTIPYPFGIGASCSANKWFEVICHNSTKPFLTSINMEALKFYVDRPLVAVNMPVTPMNCSIVQKTQYMATSLLNSPFYISSGTLNDFVVLGCQNTVSLRASGNVDIIGGCNAICQSNNSLASGYTKGVNYCWTTIPPRLQEVQYTYQRVGATINDNNNSSFCGYAFPVAQNWFNWDFWTYRGLHSNRLNPYDKQFVSAPLLLVWELDNPVISDFASCMPYISYDNYPSINYCACKNGSKGNPYLRGGCSGKEGHKIQAKMIIISIAIGLGVLILLLGAWRSTIAIRNKIKVNRKHKFFKRNGGLLLEQQLSSTNNGVEKTKLFTSKELAQATDHYNENRILGSGGQGTVYKGMLTDGRIVAVKKSKRVDEADLDVFINEVVILSQINHRNVVKLLGCCLETEVPLLVYEFIPNGTLFQHIHYPSEDFPLTWEMRLRIAREIAGALSYLHSAASAPIYHRDIKSINILLDDKYWAKVADFGTSRTVSIDKTHFTTRVLGTFGYMDPEYFRSSQFTEKSDVYSFGVVMVELLTGEKAVSSIRAEVGRSLATHFLHSMEENCLFEILDPRVVEEGRMEEIAVIAKLARRCLHLNGKRRPTMKEVAVELEGIQMLKESSSLPQNQDDGTESYAIEIGEADDFSSISSGSMNSYPITAAYLPEDHHPFLDEP